MTPSWTAKPSEQKLETMRCIMRLLRRRDWCTFDELMEETGRNWWAVSDAVGQLKGDEKVYSVAIPGERGKLLWRRTTQSVAQTVQSKGDWDRVTMTELPWRLKLSFVRKAGELRRQRVIKHGLAFWAMADMAAERHMVREGLCQSRPRPEHGLYYECGWFINPEYEAQASASLHARYVFDIGFAARTNFKATIPPFVCHPSDPDGLEYGSEVSGEHGFLKSTGCRYEIANMPRATLLWLGGVSTITASPVRDEVQAPTIEQLIQETGNIIGAAAKDHPALALFIPLPPRPRIELLTSAKEGRKT